MNNVTLEPINEAVEWLVATCGTEWQLVQSGPTTSRVRCTCGKNHCHNVPTEAIG